MRLILKSLPAWNILLMMVLIVNYGCQIPAKGPQSNEGKNVEGSEKLTIEYIAHSSFILTHNEYSILIDPFADSVWISYLFPRDVKADIIFSTHPHYDHDGGIFRNLKPYWQGKIPLIQDPGEYQKGPFEITGIKGKHCDPYGKEFDQKNTIFVFEAANIRVAHWGDNGPITDSIRVKMTDIDVLMLPIDDEYHILKKDEIDQILEDVKPRIVIPMHYKLAALEPVAGKPKDLGTIDEFVRGLDNVDQVGSNLLDLWARDIPDELTYFLFEHSPRVKTLGLSN